MSEPEFFNGKIGAGAVWHIPLSSEYVALIMTGESIENLVKAGRIPKPSRSWDDDGRITEYA